MRGRIEEFVDVIQYSQKVSKDMHDLNDWTTNLMIMLSDSNE